MPSGRPQAGRPPNIRVSLTTALQDFTGSFLAGFARCSGFPPRNDSQEWRIPMIRVSQNRVLTACVLILAVGLIALWSNSSRVLGLAEQESRMAGGTHYSVVMTEGHNLLVTDNAANKLYFYTIDKDKPIGSPLKLRASIDLTKVGEKEIRITDYNVEKPGK
jgi:hypothetical protein